MATDKEITDKTCWVTSPYVSQIAPKIKQLFKKYNFDTVFNNRQKTSLYFDKCKDTDAVEFRSNVVYNIPCKDCNMVYIGHTKRYVKKRIYEHKNDWKKDPKSYTALTKHQLDNSHRFNFEKTKILAREKNYKKRITKEMLFINKNPNSVNERTDVDNLSVIFRNL